MSTQNIYDLTDTWNAGGTTFTAIKMDVTDTASAAGSLLMDLQVGGTSQFKVGKTGTTTFSNGVVISTAGGLDLATNSIQKSGSITFGASGDLSILRDTANTLAQRNGTNAQAFRVYNTYTDASNYERLVFRWSSNIGGIFTDQAGTGTARNLQLGTLGLADIMLASNGSTRWRVSSAGHFLAEVDNTYDIGAFNAGRPRYGYFGNGVAIYGSSAGVMMLQGGDGVLRLLNYNNNDFNRLQFGGTTSSFPSLKRSTTSLQVRLADDSADAPLTAAAGTFSGAVTAPNLAPLPGGRLTLTTGVPVTVTDVTAATTIYYTPYQGATIPLYNGTVFVPTVFTELSNVTTASSVGSAGPAAVANNSNYDLFVWNDSGTLRLTRGPLWTSDTGRGTGAGTTELTLVQGIYLNAVAITNGPAASRGTYVGTVRSDGSAQISDALAFRMVWNAYNRTVRTIRRLESTASWTYSTASFRQANNSTANQINLVRGLNEDAVTLTVMGRCSNSTSTVRSGIMTVGLDSVGAEATGTLRQLGTCTDTIQGQPTADLVTYPGLGFHYLAWLEFGAGTDTQTFFSNGINGIHGTLMA